MQNKNLSATDKENIRLEYAMYGWNMEDLAKKYNVSLLIIDEILGSDAERDKKEDEEREKTRKYLLSLDGSTNIVKAIVYNGTWETKTKHYTVYPYCQRCNKSIKAGDKVKYRHYAKQPFYYLCEQCANELEKQVEHGESPKHKAEVSKGSVFYSENTRRVSRRYNGDLCPPGKKKACVQRKDSKRAARSRDSLALVLFHAKIGAKK